ncbi:RNase J family beta-CASP ribonuclease [Ruminococcaceae bacterium OttesenSCG-928-N02]|nr:RNase J family beta-CASP ribonuclease [Ruminococcaceae bacterium OttesenSCG-928-N02]
MFPGDKPNGNTPQSGENSAAQTGGRAPKVSGAGTAQNQRRKRWNNTAKPKAKQTAVAGESQVQQTAKPQAGGQPKPRQNTKVQPKNKPAQGQTGAKQGAGQKTGGPSGAGARQTAGAQTKGKKSQQKAGEAGRNTAKQQNGQTQRNAKNAQQNKNTGALKRGRGPSMQIVSLGGLGEIGKNCTVFECQGDMLLVDCGVIFPDVDMFGVDLVIPDFSFIVQNRQKFKGVLITHSHEDHIGSLPYLLKQVNLPIYGTRLTIGFIENKLKEHGLLKTAQLHVIEPGQKLKFGCMEAEAIHVNHSMPDAVAYAIDSPAGVAIITGDFKIDYTPISGGVTDLTTFAEYGKRGVLALLSDSTNAERPGFSRSERTVGESFNRLFSRATDRRIIIATFASSLHRVQQILDVAHAHGRKVVFNGRSMVNNCTMALELGYLKAADDLLIDVEQMGRYDANEIVIVTTGSQGEPLAALSRMAAGMHRQIQVGPEDFIILSASPIPGNEKGVGKIVNSLLRLGAEVIYESVYDVHVSGHAYQDEQKLLLSLVNPQYFMPVHGEYKQLIKHAGLAQSVGMSRENIVIGNIGEMFTFSKTNMGKLKDVPSGRVLVDGIGVGDVGTGVLRDRVHLAQDGLVIVVATMDGTTGETLSGPDIVTRGFVYVREGDQLMNQLRAEIEKTLKATNRNAAVDLDNIKARVRETVSNFIYKKTKRSPMILPIIMQV